MPDLSTVFLATSLTVLYGGSLVKLINECFVISWNQKQDIITADENLIKRLKAALARKDFLKYHSSDPIKTISKMDDYDYDGFDVDDVDVNNKNNVNINSNDEISTTKAMTKSLKIYNSNNEQDIIRSRHTIPIFNLNFKPISFSVICSNKHLIKNSLSSLSSNSTNMTVIIRRFFTRETILFLCLIIFLIFHYYIVTDTLRIINGSDYSSSTTNYNNNNNNHNHYEWYQKDNYV